jgi:hypothetical protein
MIPLALLCAALIGLIVYLLRHSAAQEREWSAERAELLTRIQHPKVFVGGGRSGTKTADVADDILQAVEADDIDLVGTVQTYGNSDSD